MEAKCCEIHGHDHSRDKLANNTVECCGMNGCGIERVDFDWNSVNIQVPDLQPVVHDLLFSSIFESLQIASLFADSYEIRVIGPPVSLSLIHILDQTEKEDIVIPRSKPVVEQPDEQPEMNDYEEFDTEAELLKAEAKENRKTVPEYEEEEVAADDDLVVTIAKGDDDPINEKTEEINTPELGDEEDAGFTVEVAAGNDETYDASALGTYDPRLDLSRYVFPTLDLLKAYDSGSMEINRDELAENQRLKMCIRDRSN